MTPHSDPFDHDVQCACGARAAEYLLARGFRLDVRKAGGDPLDPASFDRITAALANALSGAVRGREASAMNKALATLDVKWAELTGTDRDRVIQTARDLVANIPTRGVIKPINREFKVKGEAVIKGSRGAEKRRLTAKLGARINVDMQLGDKRVLDHMVGSQSLFVRNQYGRISSKFSDRARSIVAEQLEAGLGSGEITDVLHRELRGMGKTKPYWNVIAGVFVNRSRTYGQLASYEEAGIERFVFEAILDEVTTDQCATLHGRTFSVDAGIGRYRQTAEAPDPEAVLDIMPWIRVGKDPATGKKIMFTRTRGGHKHVIGEIVRSRVGRADDTGKQRNVVSNKQLQDVIGAFMPPLHARCRSTIVADV
jgi:hypothetical protein